jgi:SAM-dependent methyltransferase
MKIKAEVQLQCPGCHHILERSKDTFRCPGGHVELNTTPEGYPILTTSQSSLVPLAYGGDFKEGLLWKETLGHCKKVIYLTSLEDEISEIRLLRDYLDAAKHELHVISLHNLNRLKIDRDIPIVFSHRIPKKDAIRIILKYLRHRLYRYIPGAVVRMQPFELLNQGLSLLVYKLLFDRIISRIIESRYERYLCDNKNAEDFARTYLPPKMYNKEERHAFDIGCGRGRHVAMLNQLGFAVTGMDIQEQSYWRKIPEANFIIGSTECLSYFPDNIFDFIISMQVLMYLVDDEGALVHIRRMLKKDGYFLLQVTNKENLHTVLTKRPLTRDPYLQRYYSQSELCDKLDWNGFKVVRTWTEKLYTPFFVLPGNILYEFLLNRSLQRAWDRLVSPRYLGLINILAQRS